MPAMVCTIAPVYPAWHDRVCVCVLAWQDGGFHLHVSCVSCHWPQTGEPYASGQVLWRVYVLLPVWFSPQASWRFSLPAWQLGGAGWQVLATLNQPLSTGVLVEVGQFCSRFQVSLPIWLAGQARCSVTAE